MIGLVCEMSPGETDAASERGATRSLLRPGRPASSRRHAATRGQSPRGYRPTLERGATSIALPAGQGQRLTVGREGLVID
jgi:hypothetical protein